MKIISWNLLRLTGAAVEDVATLARHEKPDVLLMQEATKEMETLPSLLGGHFHRLSWLGRIHGLAVWSPHRFAVPRALSLPASRLPGRLPRRRAQIVQVGEMTFANVHLSHGQLLNRRQLFRIGAALRGKPAAIIGDYNAVGPIMLPGFADSGPREPTHLAGNVVPFRLDRALLHGIACRSATTLDFGPSDHKPIVLELVATDARKHGPLRRLARRRMAQLKRAVAGNLRKMSGNRPE